MWPFDQNNQGMYQQYAQAYDNGNYNGFDHNQVMGHIQQFMQSAPPDMQQQVYQQHFAQMPFEQRAFVAQQVPQYGMNPNDPWSMAQGFMRMGQEQPNMLQRIFSHPVMMGAGVALAGLVAKHMMERHQQNQYGQQQMGYGNQMGYQERELRSELNQVRREERELRREEERFEDREEHHHRRREREDYY